LRFSGLPRKLGLPFPQFHERKKQKRIQIVVVVSMENRNMLALSFLAKTGFKTHDRGWASVDHLNSPDLG
jgi:hypothetical protein